jgi:hypothetical protein
MKIQLNHPGSQKNFKIGKGYNVVDGEIFREWNNDTTHYRKFIVNNGFSVENLEEKSVSKGELFFWGEWEGNSHFTPFPKTDFRKLPNGLHRLIADNFPKNSQNTDPYIFGNNFLYCVCKQRGRMISLPSDSLILFGTPIPSEGKFYLDTVFVVKGYQTSLKVLENEGSEYSINYKEQTLGQLNEYLKDPHVVNKNKIYCSKSWWDDNQFFSFVPCKKGLNEFGFERLFIKLDDPSFQLSKNPTGISFLNKSELSAKETWKKIVELALNQGFSLGIGFDDPD